MHKKVDGTWPEFVRDELLPALKSGEYKQTVNTLRGIREDGQVGYCCLGVACDIAIKKGNPGFRWAGGDDGDPMLSDRVNMGKIITNDGGEWLSTLPPELATPLGTKFDPKLYQVTPGWRGIQEYALTVLNDGHGVGPEGDVSGIDFHDVIEALEGAIDPGNRTWFLSKEDAYDALHELMEEYDDQDR